MREDKRIVYNGEVMHVKYFAEKVMEDLETKDAEIERLEDKARDVERENVRLWDMCRGAGIEKRELEDALRDAKRAMHEALIERDAYANMLKRTQERCDIYEEVLRKKRYGERTEEAKNE